MQKKFQKGIDEIHIFDVFNLVWNNKGLILIFIIITLMLSYLFILSQDNQYESRIKYDAYLVPPFYEDAKIKKDLKQSFFLRSSFICWNKNREKQDNISFEELVDENLQIKFVSKNNNNYISISTTNKKLLNSMYDYVNFINTALTNKYASRAKLEIIMIKDFYKTYGLPSDSGYEQVLSLDRFIAAVDDGYFTFSVNYPSAPEITGPKPIIVILISFIIGLALGILAVFMRNELKKYREN